jgi:hypothetical protein
LTPRLRLSYHDRSRTEVFKATNSLRELRVLVDADLLGTDISEWSIDSLLASLVTHEDIDLFRYSDDGPPPGTPELSSPWGTRAAIGWAVASPEPERGLISHRVVWSDGRSISYGGGEVAVQAATMDTRADAYRDDPEGFAARRAADAIAASAAETIKADLYITKREYLHQVSWSLGRGVTFCSPADALSLIGLYLRTQGEFLVWKDPASKSTYRFNKGLFYWVGARELLPAAWRWFTACVAHDFGEGTDDLTYLGGAVLQRVARALRARDDLLRAMNCKQDNYVADDALTALDTCLVFLMGAVDAVARVAHLVLDLPSDEAYQAAWQKGKWLKTVAAKASALSAVVATGTSGFDTLTILKLLRNTVHGAGLQALAVGRPGRRDETLVGLPRADSDRILAAADRCGGRQAWGLRELTPGRMHADPGILLERLLPAVAELLNELMAATPVERLSHVNLQPEHSLPPRGTDQAFGERERQSVRGQLGL